MKKTILVALAGVALLAAPLSAEARPGGGGGFHGGGGAHAAGGFHGGGGGYHGVGGFRGAYRGGYGGYRGGYGYGGWGWGLGAAGLGFVAGAALADPYWYGDGYGPGYPVVAYPGYVAPPPQVACGQWIWNPPAARYDWVPGPCVAPPPVN